MFIDLMLYEKINCRVFNLPACIKTNGCIPMQHDERAFVTHIFFSRIIVVEKKKKNIFTAPVIRLETNQSPTDRPRPTVAY